MIDGEIFHVLVVGDGILDRKNLSYSWRIDTISCWGDISGKFVIVISSRGYYV